MRAVTSGREESAVKNSGWYWPLGLTALLVGGAGANVALWLVAAGDPSFAVEPDYYAKAVHWDQTMAQEAANAALGWSVSASFEPGARPGQSRLVARVRDRAGAPVDGARVSVVAFPSARASRMSAAALEPKGDGAYAAGLPADRPGLWELRVRVTRGGDVFTETLAEDRPAAP
jgi:nitrogen fixation protein FixH